MPDATTDLVLRVGSITGLGMADINTDNADTALRARPGTISIVVDAYGYRILQYVKNTTSSNAAIGELLSKVANTSVANITAPASTTSATTSGLTADAHDGRLCYVLDNDDTAGAAPEGETSVIANNTATVITLDAQMPYSVALAANDDLTLISNWQAADSADGDLGHNVLGVVMATDGISTLQFGWVQKEGICPRVESSSAAFTSGDPVVADVAQVGTFGSDGQELWVGIALAGESADQAADMLPVNLKIFTCAGPGTAP